MHLVAQPWAEPLCRAFPRSICQPARPRTWSMDQPPASLQGTDHRRLLSRLQVLREKAYARISTLPVRETPQRRRMKEACMAVYTCITQEGTLSAEQRVGLAQEITRAHVAISGEPASFVRVIFETVSPGSTFSGGKPAVNASIVGIIRGRSTQG